jgi:hypothetical protein
MSVARSVGGTEFSARVLECVLDHACVLKLGDVERREEHVRAKYMCNWRE